MRKFVWRLFVGLLLSATVLVLVFGPRPTDPPEPGRVHIQFWVSWAGRESQQCKDVADAFNATVGKEKNIWVDFVSMTQMDSKLLISTAGGIPPDLAITWDARLLSLANAGALEDLGPYTKEFPNLAPEKFKPVFFEGCKLDGKQYAIPYSVWAIAFIWNKAIFEQKAAELRAAGLDPERAPRTIEELDRYAAIIDTWDADHKHMTLTGFIPSQPGPFTNEYAMSFGAPYVDEAGTKLLLTDPRMIATYDWIRGYSERMGKDALAQFNSGLGQFDSPTNPFMAQQNAMEQMGPWIGAFIEKLKPSMNRWHVPEDQLKRERDFDLIAAIDPNPEHESSSGDPPPRMTRKEVEALLGPGDSIDGKTLHWIAGIKDLFVTFDGSSVDSPAISKTWKLRPADERKKYSQWGAAPFPSGVAGLNDIAYAGMDALIIPKTARHKKEAAEFLNFLLRQDMMEKLAMAHSNQSPLIQQSEEYKTEHPNAYIDVWDKVSSSPNARPLPRVVSWTQLYDELTLVAQRCALLQGTSKGLLTDLQRRAQAELNEALGAPPERYLDGPSK